MSQPLSLPAQVQEKQTMEGSPVFHTCLSSGFSVFPVLVEKKMDFFPTQQGSKPV